MNKHPYSPPMPQGIGSDGMVGLRRVSWPVRLARAERRMLKADQYLRERARHWDARGYSAIARELHKTADTIHPMLQPEPNK